MTIEHIDKWITDQSTRVSDSTNKKILKFLRNSVKKGTKYSLIRKRIFKSQN